MDNIKQYMKDYRKNNAEHIKKYKAQYRRDNKEQIAIQNEQYRKGNRETIAKLHNQWQKDNRERTLEYMKQWRSDHPEYVIQYYRNNKEKIIEYNKLYFQTEAGKATRQRGNSKHRSLGFIPLNEPFEGCEGHHISQNFVIFMPAEIHQSLYHNIWTWKNMEQMNKLAIEWLHMGGE